MHYAILRSVFARPNSADFALFCAANPKFCAFCAVLRFAKISHFALFCAVLRVFAQRKNFAFCAVLRKSFVNFFLVSRLILNRCFYDLKSASKLHLRSGLKSDQRVDFPDSGVEVC